MVQGVRLVANYAGPAELVDDETGIRVPFTEADSLIAGMREALGKLIASPNLILPMSHAAREKVRHNLTWQAKAREIVRVYEKVRGGHAAVAFLDPANAETAR